MRLHAPAEISPHPSGEQGQPARHRRALLHPHQDVSHQHALLQRQRADHLRQDPLNGSRPLWLLVNQCPDRTRFVSQTRTSDHTTHPPLSVLSARHCAIDGRSLTLWAPLHLTMFFCHFPLNQHLCHRSPMLHGCTKGMSYTGWTWEWTLLKWTTFSALFHVFTLSEFSH